MVLEKELPAAFNLNAGAYGPYILLQPCMRFTAIMSRAYQLIVGKSSKTWYSLSQCILDCTICVRDLNVAVKVEVSIIITTLIVSVYIILGVLCDRMHNYGNFYSQCIHD